MVTTAGKVNVILVGEWDARLNVCLCVPPIGILNCFNDQGRKQEEDKIQGFSRSVCKKKQNLLRKATTNAH